MKGANQYLALQGLLAAAQAPAAGEPADYGIAAAVGGAYLARARSGAPALLVPLSSTPPSVGRRGGGFQLVPANKVAFVFEGRTWEQPAAALECTDAQFSDAFVVLAADIAHRLPESSDGIRWAAVVSLVEEWQSLLGRRSGLTEEQQLGIWGELQIIHSSTDVDMLLAAWRGPGRDAVDFFLNSIGLEVKVSRRMHIHHVSLRQVASPVGLHDSYILSMWVGEDPVRGLSLADMVDALLARVADPPLLLRRLALAGYSVADRDRYSGKLVLLDNPRWFRKTDIPTVRLFDRGISEIRYVVDLGPVESLEQTASDQLWRHFRNEVPPA